MQDQLVRPKSSFIPAISELSKRSSIFHVDERGSAVTELTDKTVEYVACDCCDIALATHCIGVTEHENTCQDCLAKMSDCAEQGHSFQPPRVMYSRARAYRWLHCSRCWYDDLEPMYGVPAPQSWYRDLQVICDGKNYLPSLPRDVF